MTSLFQVVSDSVGARERATRLRAIFLDRPMPALDEGVFAIERLLRRPAGRRLTFQRRGMDLDWGSWAFAELFALLTLLVVILRR